MRSFRNCWHSWLLLSLVSPAMADTQQPPEHMVYLRTIAPGIEQDIRYASAHNFTGHPLDGYAAPECLLSLDAAQALARVHKTLQAQGYGLKVFDCYRPSRAVADTSCRRAGCTVCSGPLMSTAPRLAPVSGSCTGAATQVQAW